MKDYLEKKKLRNCAIIISENLSSHVNENLCLKKTNFEDTANCADKLYYLFTVAYTCMCVIVKYMWQTLLIIRIPPKGRRTSRRMTYIAPFCSWPKVFFSKTVAYFQVVSLTGTIITVSGWAKTSENIFIRSVELISHLTTTTSVRIYILHCRFDDFTSRNGSRRLATATSDGTIDVYYAHTCIGGKAETSQCRSLFH